jgi:RNA polymerase sigma-B factor
MTTTTDTAQIPATDLVDVMAAMPRTDPRRPATRAGAIEAWLPLAHRLARRYAANRDDLDDLRQVATVGLIKAVDGYHVRPGGRFVAYAVPTIVGELKRYFRDRCWAIRPPRRLHDLYMRIQRSRPDLAQRLGRRPTAADIASDLCVSVEEVIEALECGNTRRAGSLSVPVGAAGAEFGDLVPAGGDDYRAAELQLDLHQALEGLDERQRQVICRYFYGNQTQEEIGRRLGISQMHVSRLIHKALAVLRNRLTNQ